MSLNDITIEVGLLHPKELILKQEIMAVIDDIAGGKMSKVEVVGVLEECKLTLWGILDE